MTYRIRALKNGECQVRDYITYHDGGEETSLYYLYLWLIEGGPSPMVVETGVTDIEGFNRGVDSYIPGGVTQKPEEHTVAALRAVGVEPEDVSHVFITHFHGDHYDSFHLFPNATMVANREGFLKARPGFPARVAEALERRGEKGALLVGDEDVMPGIRCFHLGVHSECSQGIAVDTSLGRAVLTGDVVYKFRNLEEDYAPGWTDVEAWKIAAARIRREGDFFVPAHDPLVLERWPGGIIGE
ncbi:MAG: MBL fold metallo-hydrolase [Armatimonadetes bacterium]|nr:MBL fold metallo-hydrolase [Armatimonadota bacterium]